MKNQNSHSSPKLRILATEKMYSFGGKQSSIGAKQSNEMVDKIIQTEEKDSLESGYSSAKKIKLVNQEVQTES